MLLPSGPANMRCLAYRPDPGGCNSGWRQERVCRAQRPGAEIAANATPWSAETARTSCEPRKSPQIAAYSSDTGKAYGLCDQIGTHPVVVRLAAPSGGRAAFQFAAAPAKHQTEQWSCWSCRPSAAPPRVFVPRPCNRPSRRYWWRDRPSARCSLRRTGDGCRC